ncbi:helix-turn-helix domain-containing protein [uncultured Duncaniella sp.]|uniref:AlbA family DNA-binding domain-containing protein n=1 Tax=uncultured Duncaniella sp. TaxID=2768039 RepID=UPI0026760AB8|nr:ATP-binding protein [uncultured Duncaniella sp.]MCI9172441.1 ATP-binding protein [Muribaculaceae bacterium]
METSEKNEKFEKFTFPVRGSKVAGGNLYFQINYKGQEYDIKAFQFQRTKRPSKLQCIIKEYNQAGFPVFMQDIAAILPQLYTIGEEYEFRVKTPLTTGWYHEVMDPNGLVFRVYPGRNERLSINERVKCRVKSINLVRMDLELVGGRNHGIPFFSLNEFLDLDTSHAISAHLPRLLFRKLPELADARDQLESGNPLWVMTCADVVGRHLTEWLNTDLKRNVDPEVLRERKKLPHHRTELLEMFNSICLNLLETSDYLRQCAPHERTEYQDRLNKIITHTRDYLRALHLIKDRKDQTYIDDTLERLRLSGYLYNPEERMRVAMALFSLRKKSVSNYIDAIFDIIRKSHDNRRFMHLFAKAFIEMLDMYISNESRRIDALTGSGTDATEIRQMIKALSLRLLLGGGDNDSQLELYRSMHYRYVSLLSTANSVQLLYKSLSALFSKDPSPLEFTWSDLDDITMLCSKVAVSKSAPLSGEGWVYEGDNALMTLTGDTFVFTPIQRSDNMKYGIPTDLFSPARIRILLNDRMQEKLNATRNNITQFHRLWREVEHSLFAPVQHLTPSISEKFKPDSGDVVKVCITGKVPTAKYDYRVVIQDDNFKGEGTMTPLDMVSYPIIPHADVFIDPETGYNYLFQATVDRMNDDGTYHFVMRNNIHEFLKNELSVGDQCLAQVSKVDADKYMCVTDEGISMFIPKRDCNETLREGDFIITEVDTIYPYPLIKAVFVERTDETFNIYEAFRLLMASYSGGEEWNPAEAEETEEALDAGLDESLSTMKVIDTEHMRELIHLIDREGMMSKDHIETFNYLAIGRIMARLIGDSQLATYFANRMDLVESIRMFGDSGKIDDDRLQKLFDDNSEFISNYPDIETRLTRLRIINQLDKPWDNDWLWQKAKDRRDDKTSQLARLVLSYNMLDNANVYEVRRTLRRKIYQLMELKIQMPDTLKIAEEDQFTELKSSAIYPAGKNMLPAPGEQMSVLLKVMAGFMNARGGRLYVGVDDGGYATGLDGDFIYINNRHKDYDLTSMKDKFDRLVRDAVHKRLGHLANGLVTTQFEMVGDKIIYRADVDPSPEVVMLDGVAYERQGKSIWGIPTADLPKFRARRANEMK